MNRTHLVAAVLLSLSMVLSGCGGSTPASSTDIAPPAPAAAATATAVPTATPTPSGRCENGNMPVARFDIKVYAVRDRNNELREFSPRGPFYVGESLRFDSQGKDRFGQRTNGCTGEGPRWTWGPDQLVEWNGIGGWMPSAKIVAAGTLTVSARFEDGTLDFPLTLELVE